MGRGKSRLSGNKGDLFELVVDKNSYIYDDKYQEASKEASKYFDEREKLNKKILQLSDQLDKEVIVDPELGRQYSKALELYTDRGKEINAKLKELIEQEREIESKWAEASSYVREQDAKNRNLQLNEWNSNTPSLVTVTKDNYRGFEMDTHTPYLQEHLHKGEAIIVEMSPREYLQRVAYDIFNRSTLESTVKGTIPANVRKYARMMRKGTKFYMPSLNYNYKQQEGRHRALAALINGYKTIPVLIVPKRR